jgi:uncharacterized lipoprotein YmbA
MSVRHRALRSRLLPALLLCLGACSSPRVSFYTLRSPAPAASAPAPAPAPSAAADDYRVMVGPVTLPDMVDRPQMVVRVGSHQMMLLDQHRWAEPLKSEIPLVIAGNLSKLLGTREVTVHPWNWNGGRSLRVRVDVQRFDSVPGDGAILEAYWSVATIGGSEIKTGRFSAHVPVQGPAYAALAEAHGKALEALSEELAAAIRTQRTKL